MAAGPPHPQLTPRLSRAKVSDASVLIFILGRMSLPNYIGLGTASAYGQIYTEADFFGMRFITLT